MVEEQMRVAEGIEAMAKIYRLNGRWGFVLISVPWVEDDMRRELNEGMAFIIDPDNERTNGIPFVQTQRGD